MSLPDGSQEQGKHPSKKLLSALRIDVETFGPNAAFIRSGLAFKLSARWVTQCGNKEYLRDGKYWINYTIGKRHRGKKIELDWSYLSNDYLWICDRTYRENLKRLCTPEGKVSRMTSPKGKSLYRVRTGTTIRRPDWYGMAEKEITKIRYAEPEQLVHVFECDAIEMGISDAILFNKICFLFEVQRPESGYINLCPTSLSRLTGLPMGTVRHALARLADKWKRLERVAVKGRAAKYRLLVANPLAGKFTPKAEVVLEKPAPVRESKPAQTTEELIASGAVKVHTIKPKSSLRKRINIKTRNRYHPL